MPNLKKEEIKPYQATIKECEKCGYQKSPSTQFEDMPNPEQNKWEESLENSSAAKAVIALSKIINFNHDTDDHRNIATFYVDAYHKQKEIEYRNWLETKIKRLKD